MNCAKCKKHIKSHSRRMGTAILGAPYFVCESCDKIWDKLYANRFYGIKERVKNYDEAWKELFFKTFLNQTKKEKVIFT